MLIAGGLIAVIFVAFATLTTNVAAQTPTGTPAPPKTTATSTPTAAATTPAATATAAAPKASASATAAAAAPKAAEATDNTTMYLIIGAVVIALAGGAFWMKRRGS